MLCKNGMCKWYTYSSYRRLYKGSAYIVLSLFLAVHIALLDDLQCTFKCLQTGPIDTGKLETFEKAGLVITKLG
jgi:hypothetical protein